VKIINCEQGTEEWMQVRSGNVTASRVADLLTKARSKSATESQTRLTYKLQVVAERLTGASQELNFSTKFIIGGVELEPFARAAYEVSRDVMVYTPGFVLHDLIPRYGASPDGLLPDGMIEIKCPKASTHLEYLLAGVAPEEYQLQMLAGMDCCERPWCDFISYCPLLPEHLQLFVVRFPRDDKRIAEIHDEVIRFNLEVESVIRRLPQEPEVKPEEVLTTVGGDIAERLTAKAKAK
jgi:putative phage-type endonuclease